MQLGAHFAGTAIEHSMLGATHACANPLTAHYGTAHGAAIAMLLPSVVRWNGAVAGHRYAELLGLMGAVGSDASAADLLARKLEDLSAAGGLSNKLSDSGIRSSDLPMLAAGGIVIWLLVGRRYE